MLDICLISTSYAAIAQERKSSNVCQRSLSILPLRGQNFDTNDNTLGTRVKRTRDGRADFNKCDTGKGKN